MSLPATLVVVDSCVVSTPSSVALGPIVTAWETDARADGIVAGRLVEDSGCLFVDDGRRRPLLLSSGTSWDEATRSVVNQDGSTVAVGQQFSAQGGSEDLSTLVP